MCARVGTVHARACARVPERVCLHAWAQGVFACCVVLCVRACEWAGREAPMLGMMRHEGGHSF